MKARTLALLAIMATTAQAEECTDLAVKFATDRPAMTVAELDTLRICVSDQIQALVQGKELEQRLRAIDRNF